MQEGIELVRIDGKLIPIKYYQSPNKNWTVCEKGARKYNLWGQFITEGDLISYLNSKEKEKQDERTL